MTNFKVLTLNTWNRAGPWKKRWEVIRKGVKKIEPDAICFQELCTEKWRALDQKAVNEMVEGLGMTHAAYTYDSSGLMILSRYPILSSKVIRYETQSSTEGYSRGALCTEAEVSGKKIIIMTTHLSWKLDEGFVREGQVENLLSIANAFEEAQIFFAAGDFNGNAGSSEINKMFSEGKFKDSYAEINVDEGLSWDNRNKYTASHGLPERRLDYIFYKGMGETEIELEHCSLVFTQPSSEGIYASDHFGVFAEFKI